MFGKSATVEPLIAGRAQWWRITRATLMIVGAALVIVAFAGPQYGSRTRVLRKRGIDIVIALDFSKSMLARDVHPSRIKRAKGELERLLSDLDGDRVGLVAFAGDAMSTTRRCACSCATSDRWTCRLAAPRLAKPSLHRKD
jgi:Ca-activated chloride channel family protein